MERGKRDEDNVMLWVGGKGKDNFWWGVGARQRERGRGERHQRAKKDARRTRNFLDQWGEREKIFGEKSWSERDDWLGGTFGRGKSR